MLTKSLIKLWKFNKIDLVAQLLRRYNFLMSFFLFIGNDADFNRRIQKEAGSKAMIAESLSIGAELVSDPTHCFKAIYLNPNDSSFSALALLDICLNTRPGTPVYLIDPSHEIHSPTLNGSLSGNQLKGVFGIDTSFSTFLTPELHHSEKPEKARRLQATHGVHRRSRHRLRSYRAFSIRCVH